MTTIERICAHRIEFWYDSESESAVPDESEIEHVQSLLIDNVSSGELCMITSLNNGHHHTFRGWWKILTEDINEVKAIRKRLNLENSFIEREIECPLCLGNGSVENNGDYCQECDGTGKVLNPEWDKSLKENPEFITIMQGGRSRRMENEP